MSKPLQIAVYAVCKNEQPNVFDWLHSIGQEKIVIVGDLGSTDGTISCFENQGVQPRELSIKPFRFDDARNAVLATVPAEIDVCVSLDLDERLSPDWQDVLEASWVVGETTQAFHKLIWDPQQDAAKQRWFMQSRIHARHGYRWKYPVHEGLYTNGPLAEKSITIPELVITQYPDLTKDRSQYLSLLRMGLDEYPDDPRMVHYYGRELMYHRRYGEALEWLELYTRLPGGFPYEQAENAECMMLCYRAIGQ
jgi:hypothetical protein